MRCDGDEEDWGEQDEIGGGAESNGCEANAVLVEQGEEQGGDCGGD